MNYFFFLVFSLSFVVADAQQRMTTPDEYARRGRKLGTAAWILAGSGATLIAAGTILAVNVKWDELDYDDNGYGENETLKAVGAVALIGTGVIASIGSVPLFIISAKNKRKAASFSFRNERYPQFMPGKIASASLPALTLRLKF